MCIFSEHRFLRAPLDGCFCTEQNWSKAASTEKHYQIVPDFKLIFVKLFKGIAKMSAKMLERINKTPSRYYNMKKNGLRNKKEKVHFI